MKKTTSLKKKDLNKNWYIIDCSDQIIGRLATRVSTILQGKNKPNYAPNLNNGDAVILINTSKIKWTGAKATKKLYRKYSGFMGGLKELSLEKMMEKNPNVVLEHAVSKMLPKTRMRDEYMKNLHLYRDEKHNHEAQQPSEIHL